MSKAPSRLYLIDGYSNIFRAFYAIRNLSNAAGEPTNAVFGFLQILRKLLRDESPAYLGIALDVGRATIRTEKYADYKANRAPMPEDLRVQIPWIRKLIEAYRIPIIELPRYEADDVLGTLAKKASAEGFEVVLLSADKDLMQLVGDGVFMYHTGRDKLYDAALVEEDFGVPPKQVIEVLALMGDSSDNVPGVPGIGKKGAEQLVRQFGTVEAVLDGASEIKRKSYREGLEQHRDLALLSKELVTIHTDLEVEFDPVALRCEEPDAEALLEIFRALDFTFLRAELEREIGGGAAAIKAATEAESSAAFLAATAELDGRIFLGLVGEDSPLGLAVRCGERLLWADFRHDDLRQAVLERLRQWTGDSDLTLVGHDLKEVLRLGALEPVCRLFDTMLGAYLLHPAARSQSLAAVALERLAYSALSAQEAGWSKEGPPLPGHKPLLRFAAERVVLAERLEEGMREGLAEEGLESVYETFEEPLLPVLLRMEEVGVLLDKDFLGAMSEELGGEIGGLEGQIYDLAGERFNIGSPKQLGEVMFEKLGYPVIGRTRKTKSYSTGADTLEELSKRGFPLPERLLRYRELTKLKSTYVDALPVLVAEDGRVHTRFNQAVAATGRLSSAHPNLQNIPVRTELGQRIRKAFRAQSGWRLVVADYSQIELRVLAHIAGEKAMQQAFKEGRDIHSSTAAAVFGVAVDLVNSEQRRAAKVINFGIIYGMSAFGLARNLGISRPDAQTFIDAYMKQYAGVAAYTEETLTMALDSGKVETLYGRIRRLPDIQSKNRGLRENAQRMAINARIQGTAADLLKLAMIHVDRRLARESLESRLLLTVHDELVLEVPEAEVDTVTNLVREEMEGVAELSVPLVVETGVGQTWYDAKG